MPCPHNEISIVQRSHRQSAVAAAAYQSGEKLFCEYDQEVKHYPEKRGIVHNEILLPANAPPEYADRNTLWNAAEAVEKQWNSQLARRWVLTIPREIPPDQYAVLIREFCEQQFVSKGMIVDFGKNHCTQHRIDYDTLYSHVLRKIRECARAALMDGEAVADRLTNTCEAEQREQREAMERSLTRDEERIEVLDKMVMRLYEDMIAGRISEQNFNTMLEKTQTEQTELKAKVSEGRKRLSDEVQLANDAKQWVEAIQEYANITELDAATLNRLIKEIVVHERIDEDKTRHISIEIHFNLKPIPEVEQVTA